MAWSCIVTYHGCVLRENITNSGIKWAKTLKNNWSLQSQISVRCHVELFADFQTWSGLGFKSLNRFHETLFPHLLWVKWSKWDMLMLSRFSCVWFCNPWTVVRESPLPMGFSRQKYRNGLPCPPLGDLPNPVIEPMSLMSPALAGGFFTTSATWGAPNGLYVS